jgi:Zn-dependent peptidase ImmA (M78 family)/DNA-binding XRE family transcriptional regulator
MIEKQYNSEILKLLRKSRNISQNEICKQVGLSQGNYSKVEHGLLEPSEIFVKQVSSFFKVDSDFFYQDEKSYSPQNPYHRSRSTLQIGDRDRVEAIANIYRIHIKKLLEAVEISYNLSPIPVSETVSPEGIARLTRKNFHLPNGPVTNLTKVLEDNGIFVISYVFGTEALDGFTIHGAKDILPVIFINSSFPGERIRFTLAHELGHLVMHQQLRTEQYVKNEKEANVFASEFLMPTSDIIQDLRYINTIKLNVEILLRLKMKWKVSMNALLKRAIDLGVLTKNQKNYLWMQMSQNGFRRNEPYPIPIEAPLLLNELINIYKNKLQYSIEDIATLLKVTQDTYSEYFENNRPRLKLIKPFKKEI